MLGVSDLGDQSRRPPDERAVIQRSNRPPCDLQAAMQAAAEGVPTGSRSDLVTADAAPSARTDGQQQRSTAMTVTRRTTTIVIAAVAAVALAVPGHASARRTPPDGPESPPASAQTSDSGRIPSGGRPDEQFWGEATWVNPLSGLNLDRSSVGG
jgi:anti-sigma-K factor RskA